MKFRIFGGVHARGTQHWAGRSLIGIVSETPVEARRKSKSPSADWTSEQTELRNGAFAADLESCSARLTGETILEGERGHGELAVRPPSDDGEVEYRQRSPGISDSPGRIVIIEPRAFLRDCIQNGMRSRFAEEFVAFPSIDDFERSLSVAPVHLIILSCWMPNEFETSGRAALGRLVALGLQAPVVVIASRQDSELLRAAVNAGAKGFIPMSMGFDLAVHAIFFVLAGGTYVPAEGLMMAGASPAPGAAADRPSMTSREHLVTRAIRQGKPNKIIAYELNMCENTVKVHVRHIMKKLGAKNRTEVAMKSKEFAHDTGNKL